MSELIQEEVKVGNERDDLGLSVGRVRKLGHTGPQMGDALRGGGRERVSGVR